MSFRGAASSRAATSGASWPSSAPIRPPGARYASAPNGPTSAMQPRRGRGHRARGRVPLRRGGEPLLLPTGEGPSVARAHPFHVRDRNGPSSSVRRRGPAARLGGTGGWSERIRARLHRCSTSMATPRRPRRKAVDLGHLSEVTEYSSRTQARSPGRPSLSRAQGLSGLRLQPRAEAAGRVRHPRIRAGSLLVEGAGGGGGLPRTT